MLNITDKLELTKKLSKLLSELKSLSISVAERISKSGERIKILDTLGVQVAAQPKEGRVSYVVTAKGDEVKTGFKLVEADSLIPSNTSDGRINPDFPQELQPRDRTRASSLLQISKMANQLRPAQLTDSGLSSHGAPIVGGDNVVESGNGRTMAIVKAYQEGKADSYREFLIENADQYGFKQGDVEKLKRPVLVRERLTEVDRAKFARDSNLSDLQQMSSSETAWVDAERINDSMMGLFNPSDTGNLIAQSNQGFINSFLTEIGDNSTAGLLTEDGRPTKQLVERMQNAVFAKAYKNEKLVKLVAEEPDPEIRNILTALNGAAGSFVEMQYLDGEIHKQTVDTVIDAVRVNKESPTLAQEALEALVGATELVRQARDTGQSIDELLSQSGLFGDSDPNAGVLARFISANNRSAKRLATAFKSMAKAINQELQTQGQAIGDMFGGGELSLVDVLARVNQELESEGIQSGFMFESMAKEEIDEKAQEAATSPENDKPLPSQSQLEAGNYKKGHIEIHGLKIAIENPKGSKRSGRDVEGNYWSVTMNQHYGYIKTSKGADGDGLDVFIGDNPESEKIFIVDQLTPDLSKFDEHKIMIGFDNFIQAKEAYLSNYDDKAPFGAIKMLTVKQFKTWLRGTTKSPVKWRKGLRRLF